MTPYTVSILSISLSSLLLGTGIHAGPFEPPPPHQEILKAVHDAKHDVDHAWEVYHRAYLGGTVASPQRQAEIEEHLHQAGTLITQAQEAADQGDKRHVENLIKQVHVHTTHAIEGSKESKK